MVQAAYRVPQRRAACGPLMLYATRNHAFAPPTTWVLDDASLRIEDDRKDGAAPRFVSLADVTAVRLEFAPTRAEPNRYRCRLTLRDGDTLSFFNRTYVGLYNFPETNPAYVAFVQALHRALARHAPHCRFSAGASAGAYALSLVASVFVALLVATAAVLLFFHGLEWLILLKLAVLAFFLPNVLRWLGRNKPRSYTHSAIPPEVLPTLPLIGTPSCVA